jgi:exonuclease V
MKGTLYLLQIHTLKLRIPIPNNIVSKSTKLKDTTAKSSPSVISKKLQYTDEEVYTRINEICNAINIKNSKIDNTNFKSSISKNDSEFSNVKDIDKKLDALATYLSMNKIDSLSCTQSGSFYLPAQFLTNTEILSPYSELCKLNKSDQKTRLSITKIVPYSYCELKKMYQLYIGDSNIETVFMQKGKEIHKDLEIGIHPQVDVKLETKLGPDLVVSVDKSNGLENTKQQNYVNINKMIEREDILRKLYMQKITHLNEITENSKLDNVDKTEDFLKEKFNTIETANDESSTSKIHDVNDEDGNNLLAILIPKDEKEELEENKIMEKKQLLEPFGGKSDNKQVDELKEISKADETQVEELESIGEEELKEESETEDTITEPFFPIIKLQSNVDPVSTMAYKLTQTLMRLLKLLEYGECREILVHAFYDKERNIVLNSLDEINDINDNDILLSGIIDGLRISSQEEDAFNTYKLELQTELENVYGFDEIFYKIKKLTKYWTDSEDPMLYLIINDDKTRISNRKPSLDQQNSQMLQVGMYRKLLGLLTNDKKFTYKSWCENLINRGELIFEPLSNDLVTFICMFNNHFFYDFINLKNGNKINSISEIDSRLMDIVANNNNYTYKNNSNNSDLNLLEGDWEIVPTLGHIIARLAQVLNLLDPFMHNKLQVTYIGQRNNRTIGRIERNYDESFVDDQINQGMKLWLGKREPVPTNSDTICKYCEFNTRCQIPLRRQGLL